MKLVATKNYGHYHWCPACEQLHRLPETWQFDGDFDSPTFTPSFKHTWGEPAHRCCHYILTKGVLNYCVDCTHTLANQRIPLPEIPPEGLERLERWLA